MNAMPNVHAIARAYSEQAAMSDLPPDPKRPLTRELAPCPPFPGDALGPLRKAAEGVRESTQAPFAICAQSVLAAATLAVQAHRDVTLPGGGRKPLTGLFATVAESGERKSSCDALALRAVYRIEEQWRAEYGPKLDAYRADWEGWKAATDTAKKAGNGKRAEIKAALASIGPEPKPPPHPMLLVADPTPEALVKHVAEGRPYAGLFTAEGGGLIGGHAMSDDNRMRTAALLNTLWDGTPIRRLRMGTGTQFLPGRRVSVHIMMQGVVASVMFGDAMLAGQGLLARFLTVAPETTAGTRFYRAPTGATHLALADYEARLTELLKREPATAPDQLDVLDPPALTLDRDAERAWIAFHDEVERANGPEGDYAPIRAFASKLAEHAGRLAGVLATYADSDTLTVTGEHMACGIELARHYGIELLRLGEAAAVAPDLRLAQRLLAWWQTRPDPRVHLAQAYQGLNFIRDATTARRIVPILEEHGWISRLRPGTVLDGSTRREAWTLVQ